MEPSDESKITLVVDGVPKNGNTKDAEKWLRKWGVEEAGLLKVKKAHQRPSMTLHVAGQAAADRVAALLQGKDSGKGRAMHVRQKDPNAHDAYESERKRPKKEQAGGEIINDVRDVVTPLWKVPYEEQLDRKNKALQSVLKQMYNKTRRESKGKTVPPWGLTEVTPMQLIEGGEYRNKLSFTIGSDSTGAPCIGFRVGRTERGSTAVADPSQVSFCNPSTLAVRHALQAELEKEDALPPYNNLLHSGFWRQLEVRTNLAGDSLAVIQVDETGIEPERLAKERANALIAIKAVPGVIGLGWQHNGSRSQGSGAQAGEVQFLFGDGRLEERIRDVVFHIPPRAFFQTNSVRVVALYDMACDMVRKEAARLAAPGRTIKVYDVCCGIGTIGLYLRRNLGDAVGEVIGIDIEPTGIEAAQQNAQLNKLTGVSFIASAAEKVLPSRLKDTKNETIIAVVDPPRAGLHPDVLRALRNCLSVESVVYISCNTKSLVQDTVPLCKPNTKRYENQPFEPTWMSGVDMFPNTEISEATVIFQRKPAPPAEEAEGKDGQQQQQQQVVEEKD